MGHFFDIYALKELTASVLSMSGQVSCKKKIIDPLDSIQNRLVDKNAGFNEGCLTL